MAKIRAFSVFLLVALVFFTSSAFASVAEEETVVAEVESVVTLDHTNFTEFIKKHDFVVVEFYAPWCGHCKKLAPEYEKAATILKGHDPVIVLAKVDANEELNKDLATEYDVKGFPTLKILKKGGESAHEYKGPRDADGIVEYLKKQSGPASVEIKSSEDATSLIGDKKIFIVGIFPEFSGEAFENFTKIAEKMRGDYEFGHTLDAKLLPRGDSKKGSRIRLFKPFDELTVDFHDFDTDAAEKFVEESSIPLVTFFNKDPDNHPFVIKFFNTQHSKAMLFVNVTAQTFEDFKAKYQSIAEEYKGQGLGFLLGDVEASQGAFQYFGLKEDQVPLVIIQKTDGEKYLKEKVEPGQLAAWIKDFKEGLLKPFRKSEPIPEVNDQPVKVVVADNLQDMVLKSGKNVLLEFYAPWCGHCKKLAPILDEVALSFESDADVVITKMDATANDFPADIFEVQGYPTLFLYSSTGRLVPYDGSRTKEDIIEFIQKNRDGGHATPETTDTEDVVEPVKDESQPESVKDEL